MAYTEIDDPTIYFNTVLYTGANQTVTGVNFQPSLSWFKQRTTAASALFDSVRGATKFLESSGGLAEQTQATSLTSFTSDGFVLGSDATGHVGGSSTATVSWNWKESATSGFDIVQFTGNGSNRTISHSLSAVPKVIIVKNLASSDSWNVYHSSAGNTHRLFLDTDGAPNDTDTAWNDTTPTSSVFTVGTNTGVNANTQSIISYLWSEKQGFSKFGSYIGNSASSGSYIHLGFSPAFVILKKNAATGQWRMIDNKRPGYNVVNKSIYANLTNAESSDTMLDFTAQGFKIRSTDQDVNSSGVTYVYLAFAEAPFVNSNGVPCNAR